MQLQLRPEVSWFAQQMEQVLRANDHKPGWKDWSRVEAFERLEDETEELRQALGVFRPKATLEERMAIVIKEAVDVANFAMMIADITRMDRERKGGTEK